MSSVLKKTALSVLDVSQWNTSNVTNMSNMFASMSKITTLNVSKWDTSKVTKMNGMFSFSNSLSELDFSSWDTSNVATMTYMFLGSNGIRTLTVGRKSIFAADVSLREIPTSDKEYTGRWERIEPSSPLSVYESSMDFMRSYKGEMPGTYVWQKTVDLTSIKAKDSTIYSGTSWTAADNFISATDKDGNLIELAQVTVSGTVDTTTPGEYDVTYNYGGQSTTIKVTVVENQETLVVKDSTIYVNSPWTAADNFISATDKEGKAIDLSQLTVIGTVDNQTPGMYEINYTYKYPTRSEGKVLSKTAIITVLNSVPVDSNAPEVPTKPVVPSLPTAPLAPEKPTNYIDYTSDLPQAGEKSLEQILFSLLGSVTLVAAWFLGFGKRHKYGGN